MLSTRILSIILTAAATLASMPALAANRCHADLSRLNPAFCLDGRPDTPNPSYSWQVNDSVFDLSAAACLGLGDGVQPDTVFAVDRSQSTWASDQAAGKLGADNLATTRYLIEKLRDAAVITPATAPQVSVVMFASAGDCREYTGGSIVVNREFPCLFVPAKTIGDAAHVARLLAFLEAAKNKYDQGSMLARTSAYGVVADLLAADGLGFGSAATTGLMLLSAGRTYSGEAGDPYLMLRQRAYQQAQADALAKFAAAPLKKYRTVLAMPPVPLMPGDTVRAEDYATMCALPQADAADCDPTSVDANKPSTWPVTNLDIKAFARNLVQATGSAPENVVTLSDQAQMDAALERLRHGAAGTAPIDAVSYRLGDGALVDGAVRDGRVVLTNLPAGSSLGLQVLVKSHGREVIIPMTLTTTVQPFDGQDLQDREMLCSADAAQADVVGPAAKTYKLQGGAASCGIVGASVYGGTGGKGQWLLLLLPLIPLLVSFLSRRLGVAMLAALAAGGHAATAEAAGGKGANTVQFRPVIDGLGTTEKATPVPTGQVSAGLTADYANDPIELADGSKKRVRSVVDDMVVLHAAANAGVYKGWSLGLDIPYVHKSDVERSVAGKRILGGNLGQPADATLFAKALLLARPAYALGLLPLVTLPIGDAAHLLGDGAANYGLLLLVSGARGSLSWAVNTGYIHKQDAALLQDDSTAEVKVTGAAVLGIGAEYRILSRLVMGASLQAKMAPQDKGSLGAASPAEWSAYTKTLLISKLQAMAGFGTGIGSGYGAPDYRVYIGAAWVPY